MIGNRVIRATFFVLSCRLVVAVQARIKKGDIEFWPNNGGPINQAHVPNSSNELGDFGDEPSEPVAGYGSMQVHDYQHKQTLLAVNRWSAGPKADVGIGNSDGRTRDWTFKANAASYEVKRLRILVLPVSRGNPAQSRGSEQ